MNAIMCELCGSNDVVKQGEYFVCQHCGTKYSLEDARKLIGIVKIDNSDFVQKYLQNARRAKEKEDWEETEKYYNMVEQNDPDNIEAIFYSAYGKAKVSLTSADIYRRQAVFNSLQKCISIIDDHYDPEKEQELRPIIEQISNDLFALYKSSFVYTKKTNETGATTNNSQITYTMFAQLALAFVESIDNIISKFSDARKAKLGYLYQILILHLSFIENCDFNNYDAKRGAVEQIDRVHKQWHTYDPDHIVPNKEEKIQKINSEERAEQKKKTSDSISFFVFLLLMVFIFVFIYITNS